MERLSKQVDFVIEIDKLKNIIRRSYISDGLRLENSAEHSWHVSVLAILMAEYADPQTDLLKVVKMLLIHDIVEIDAGDTYFYDQKGNKEKAEKESKAAKRLFGLLPNDQRDDFQSAWEEYEVGQTREAVFAYALDRFIPVLHAFYTEGKSWKEHGICVDQVSTLLEPIRKGSEKLCEYTQFILNEALEKGYLKPSPNS